jgi:hypothetical protein
LNIDVLTAARLSHINSLVAISGKEGVGMATRITYVVELDVVYCGRFKMEAEVCGSVLSVDSGN